MKRPLCLVGTTLVASAATTGGLLAAGPVTAGPDNYFVARGYNDGPPDWPERFVVVPVPPAAPDDDERASLNVGHDHRPHPSYLNQTANFWPELPPSTSTSSSSLLRHRFRNRKLTHSSSGTFRNLVLLLRFSDHADRELPSKSDISRLYNSEDAAVVNPSAHLSPNGDRVAPTGSVRQVYLANSYGHFLVDTKVTDWIDLPNPERYYAAGNHGFSKFKEAIVEALDALDNLNNLGGPGFDFDRFDVDENGALDGLGVLHSGYGAEYGGSDCFGAENTDRIWSHKGGLEWTSSPTPGGDSMEGVRVNRYYVSSALRGKCNANIVRMGVICHELGHYIGLPDLYDSTFDGTGLGAYDFMAQSWGWDGSGMYPPHLSAWSKLKVGWARAETIQSDGTYALSVSASNDTVYKISANFPEGEYLLLENRQPVGYDSNMERGGIAIYHVDETVDGQLLRGYPTVPSNGWPGNGEHYMVALLGADGDYDLEKGANQGDDGDLWHSGSSLTELKPGTGTFPNTDTYQNGIVSSTGIRIFGFSASGNVMTFQVEGLGNSLGPTMGPTSEHTRQPMSAPTSMPTSTPTSMPTSTPTLKPATQQPTLKPATIAPSKQPTGEPITLLPTSNLTTLLPSSNPSLSLTSSPTTTPKPTLSPTTATVQPTTEAQLCADLCLVPVPPAACPAILHDIKKCTEVTVGQMCDVDGECGTDGLLNNCLSYDVYQRVDCSAMNSPDARAEGKADAVSASAPAIPADAPSLGTATHVYEHHAALDGMTNLNAPVVLTQPMEDPTESMVTLAGPVSPEDDSMNLPTSPPTNQPTTPPSMAPTAKPTGLIIVGSSGSKPSATGSGVSSANNSATSNGAGGNGSVNIIDENENNCPYYPGWNIGLTHCLKDCLQPSYMHSNPIFEFDNLDDCCGLHFQGSATCRTQALMDLEKISSTAKGLPSVGGRAWRDDNGDGVQDEDERRWVGHGVPNVIVDLYECPLGTTPGALIGEEVSVRRWVQGTRTSADGSYLLPDIPAEGLFYVQITPPAGYRLPENGKDFDESGRSKCMDMANARGGFGWGESLILDVGLIPGGLGETTETELVSVAIDGGRKSDQGSTETMQVAMEEGQNNESIERAFTSTHTKSHTIDQDGIDSSNNNNEPKSITPPQSPNYNSLHAKTYLRGTAPASSSYSSTGGGEAAASTEAAKIIIHPSGDATIHSNEAMKYLGGDAELLVGPESTWHDDILLKFDMTPFAPSPEHSDHKLPKRAVLRLYSLTSSPSGGIIHVVLDCDSDASLWDEDNVSWSTAPQEGEVIGQIGQTRPNSWVEADVTGVLSTTDSLTNGSATLRITSEASNHSWLAKFSSKENGEGHPAPELWVYF